MKRKFMVTIVDTVPYLVKASSFDEAIEIAIRERQREIEASNPKPKARSYDVFEIKE